MGLANDDAVVQYFFECRKSLMASTLEQELLTVVHQNSNIFGNINESLRYKGVLNYLHM